MDLQNEWENMNEELTVREASSGITANAVQQESKGLYETLRKNLGYKLMWIRIISVPMLIGAFFTSGGLQYLLVGEFLIYEIGRILMMRKLKHMPPGLDYAEVTKSMLVRQLELVNDILKAERIWGFIFIPLSAPIGLIAYQLFAHQDVSALYAGPHALLYLALVIGFALIGLVMAKKMNDIAFSKHIKKLTENIGQMS